MKRSINRNAQINIRVPSMLREALKKIADVDDRSVNYVVVTALERFVKERLNAQ